MQVSTLLCWYCKQYGGRVHLQTVMYWLWQAFSEGYLPNAPACLRFCQPRQICVCERFNTLSPGLLTPTSVACSYKMAGSGPEAPVPKMEQRADPPARQTRWQK